MATLICKTKKFNCTSCGELIADKEGQECKSCFEQSLFESVGIQPTFRLRMSQAPPHVSRDIHF